jgi:hypothetical protein
MDIIAILMIFSEVAVRISMSFTKRLKPPSHAKVRSTIHLTGSTKNVSLIFVEMCMFNFKLSATQLAHVPL